VEEHLQLVRREPTSLEVHTALANSYVMLSSLYAIQDEDRHATPEILEELRGKFRIAAERAIEEFKILNDYAPNDPWIHTQLAYSYHDLQMPESEIREYEIILKLRPDDRDTLFRLGRLSFQLGMNAKGLKVYEGLQRYGDKRADDLISYYGV
jgi:tetratricopeptide (TPR) repeat protein